MRQSGRGAEGTLVEDPTLLLYSRSRRPLRRMPSPVKTRPPRSQTSCADPTSRRRAATSAAGNGAPRRSRSGAEAGARRRTHPGPRASRACCHPGRSVGGVGSVPVTVSVSTRYPSRRERAARASGEGVPRDLAVAVVAWRASRTRSLETWPGTADASKSRGVVDDELTTVSLVRGLVDACRPRDALAGAGRWGGSRRPSGGGPASGAVSLTKTAPPAAPRRPGAQAHATEDLIGVEIASARSDPAVATGYASRWASGRAPSPCWSPEACPKLPGSEWPSAPRNGRSAGWPVSGDFISVAAGDGAAPRSGSDGPSPRAPAPLTPSSGGEYRGDPVAPSIVSYKPTRAGSHHPGGRRSPCRGPRCQPSRATIDGLTHRRGVGPCPRALDRPQSGPLR